MTLFKYLFTTIGLVFLGAALYLYLEKQTFLKKAEVAQGTVIELSSIRSKNSSSYCPLIEFTTKSGQKIKFWASYSSNPPSHDVGENVTVFYNPNAPDKAEINGFFSLYLAPFIFGVLGTIFFSIGFLTILFGYLKQKKSQYLLTNGKRISTKFERVHLNTSFESNDRNPYLIYSQWLNPETNDLYVFKSENIWFNPTNYIKSEEIKVVIDPNDPKKYVMDISFLPKLKN